MDMPVSIYCVFLLQRKSTAAFHCRCLDLSRGQTRMSESCHSAGRGREGLLPFQTQRSHRASGRRGQEFDHLDSI